MKHGIISLAGWAGLASWAALGLLTPSLIHSVPSARVRLAGAGLVLGGILFTLLWACLSWLWWRTKLRAAAEHERQSAKHRQRESDFGR